MTDTAISPPTPRPLTPRARSRSWAEMHVRPWVLLTAVFLVAALLMGATRLRTVSRERRVVESGVPVTARVVQVGTSPQHQAERNESLFVRLEYKAPGSEQSIVSDGYLPRKPGTVIKRDGPLAVKIDPDDPKYFSDRDAPPPYTAELAVPILLAAIATCCAIATLLARRRVLRTFATGDLRTATVAGVKQSPAAPLSKQIGFTIDGDPRVYQCYWPNKLGAVAVGDSIDVIVPAADPSRAIAARAYEAAG